MRHIEATVCVEQKALVTKVGRKTAGPPQGDEKVTLRQTETAAGIEDRGGRNGHLFPLEIDAVQNLVTHEGKAALGGGNGILPGNLLRDPTDPRIIPVDPRVQAEKGLIRHILPHERIPLSIPAMQRGAQRAASVRALKLCV